MLSFCVSVHRGVSPYHGDMGLDRGGVFPHRTLDRTKGTPALEMVTVKGGKPTHGMTPDEWIWN